MELLDIQSVGFPVQHERGIGPATLPSSDDFDRNDRAQLHGGGILHILTDLEGFPSKLSLFVHEHLERGTRVSSNSSFTETRRGRMLRTRRLTFPGLLWTPLSAHVWNQTERFKADI